MSGALRSTVAAPAPGSTPSPRPSPPAAAGRKGDLLRIPTPTGRARPRRPLRATEDPPAVRFTLTALALLFLAAFVLVPSGTVVVEALRDGHALWWEAIVDEDALAALRLTLLVAAIAVPVNALFGLAAAWSLTRFRYRGKNVLVSLIDLPFGVSPVISGMVTILLFGAHGLLGP